jgi:predicted SprT family Zn-dependent metalloprotease
MNLHEAAYLARELIAQHALIGWRFEFDHARRRFGKCDYTNRRITLSRHLTFLNGMDEVRDTILHEIAHALCPGDGHGPKWRATCVRIGARPKRCFTEAQVVTPPRRPARYQMGCPKCNWWVDRRRLTRQIKRYVCKHCRGKVVMTLNET